MSDTAEMKRHPVLAGILSAISLLAMTGTAAADGPREGGYPGMMDGYGYSMMYAYPFFGGMFLWMGFVWIIQLIIGYFIYRDAKERQMNAVLWFILVILPMIGWLFLVLYVILRETGHGPAAGKGSAETILDERFAKGEIALEEYQRMKEELRK